MHILCTLVLSLSLLLSPFSICPGLPFFACCIAFPGLILNFCVLAFMSWRASRPQDNTLYRQLRICTWSCCLVSALTSFTRANLTSTQTQKSNSTSDHSQFHWLGSIYFQHPQQTIHPREGGINPVHRRAAIGRSAARVLFLLRHSTSESTALLFTDSMESKAGTCSSAKTKVGPINMHQPPRTGIFRRTLAWADKR